MLPEMLLSKSGVNLGGKHQINIKTFTQNFRRLKGVYFASERYFLLG